MFAWHSVSWRSTGGGCGNGGGGGGGDGGCGGGGGGGGVIVVCWVLRQLCFNYVKCQYRVL